MQTNIPEWKPTPKEKDLGNHQSIPMFQPLPPQEPQPDRGFPGTFMEANTEALKKKAKELGLEEPPKQHDDVIKHDHHRPQDFVVEFQQMKRIYKVICKGALERLIAINDALRDLNLSESASLLSESASDADKGKAARAAYEKATADFERFCAELDNPHVQAPDPNRFTNGITLKWASIQPKVLEGGFISGAKVIVRWAGGSHISSDSLP
jgi:hypothetical protein